MPYLPITDGNGNLLEDAHKRLMSIMLLQERWKEGLKISNRIDKGERGAINELNTSYSTKIPGLRRAGWILHYTLSHAYHEPTLASISRTSWALEEVPPDHQNIPPGVETPHQGSWLRNWKRHKNIAHLAWAYIEELSERHVIESEKPSLPERSEAFLLSWLATAEALRLEGESFVPHHGGRPLLDPNATWRCPSDLSLPDPRPYLAELSPEFIAILERY